MSDPRSLIPQDRGVILNEQRVETLPVDKVSPLVKQVDKVIDSFFGPDSDPLGINPENLPKRLHFKPDDSMIDRTIKGINVSMFPSHDQGGVPYLGQHRGPLQRPQQMQPWRRSQPRMHGQQGRPLLSCPEAYSH